MQLIATPVTRSIDLPISADRAWASLADADGLAGWLGDAVDLDRVEVGAAGTVTEGDAVRRLVVTEVDAGRSIGFVWWDEAAPAEASVVTIAVSPAGDADGGSTVTVTERITGAAVASMGDASVRDLLDVETAWDCRLQALVGESTTSALVDACV